MQRAKVHRSTPFRLAVTFGLLFVAAFLASGFISYQLLKRELGQALDTAVNEVYSVTASSYTPDDVEDLISTINTYAALKTSEDRIFSLTDATGNHVAGNIRAPLMADGLASLGASDVKLEGDTMYRVRAGSVGGYRLVVGQSFAETDDLEEVALISFAWALVIIVFIAIAGGVFLASRAQKRLDGIARTMVDISNGQMHARIPLLSNNDDIDIVSRQINHALDRLAGLVEGMRQVSADIAHELKTPLNRLKMTIEDAATMSQKGLSVDQQLADALAESDQINGTFEALLRISQIEAGARKTRFAPVDLTEILSVVAEIYTGVAEDNGQTLRLELRTPHPAFTSGDRELLIQLFVNLVENAINHCPAGTSINLFLALENGLLVGAVSDNGPGIPTGEQEKVFRRLYRLDKSRTTPGSGLGLSLVKAICDLHSGRLNVHDNAPGLTISVAFQKLSQITN